VSAYLAPSLVGLRAELNKAFPKRRKPDGWIGDPAHAARVSDHNPDPNSKPAGCVDALDVAVDDGDPTKDLRTTLIRRAIAHPSTHYVISNGIIYSRAYGFRPRTYTGSNGHYHHVHVSILKTAAARTSTRPWGIAVSSRYPTLKFGSHGPDVLRLTVALNKHGYPTSDRDVFGNPTFRAMKQMQTAKLLPVDGICTADDWKALGL
jgi:hypothetical protein